MEMQVTTSPPVAPGAVKKGPRPRSAYRAAVRNTWKAARRLAEFREQSWRLANARADLAGRAVIANGARETASKALAGVMQSGLRRDTAVASAMLDFYSSVKRTRPVSRIIRQIEQQLRAA
jgi:hypothetical protein